MQSNEDMKEILILENKYLYIPYTYRDMDDNNGGKADMTPSRSNLNRSIVTDDQGDTYFYGTLSDYSTVGTDGKTHVFFRNLEEHLINYINQADVVLGCVAWFTNEKILQALIPKYGVSFIVQKEDFLKPDLNVVGNWKNRLHQLYSNLPRTLDKRDFHGTALDGLICKPDPFIDPVRCVGNSNVKKQAAFPRSHHKFAIFCKYKKNCTCKYCSEYKKMHIDPYYEGKPQYVHCNYCFDKSEKNHLVPYAVWTGSFNFTKNASVSFENAVLLQDPKIVYAFYQEYAQIAAISEPLNWDSQWVNPEWVIQTWT